MRKIILPVLLIIILLVQLSYADSAILTVSAIKTITSPHDEHQILVKFTNLPLDFGETSRILKAELKLNLGFTPRPGRDEGVDIKIHRVNRTWNSATVTYSSFYSEENAVDTSHYYLDYLYTESDKLVLDVNEYVKEWFLKGNNGLIITTQTAGSDISIPERIETRDIGSLELIYSPVRE